MKKYLISLGVGLMALTSCTSEEVVDVSPSQGNAIGFENVVNKSTRAIEGDLNNSTFDNFLVYGYYTKEGMTTPIQIFNGVPVSKVNNQWIYNGVRYWVPKCTYFFYAYSCADIALITGKGSPAMTLTNESSIDGRALAILSYLCDGSHQHDLVCAEKESVVATDKDNPQVGLQFKHALCKVKAVFTTDFPEGYEVKVSNVKLTHFNNIADYNVGTDTWSQFKSETETGDPVINLALDENNNITTANGKYVETSEVFMIPKKYPNTEYVTIHFTIDVTKNGETILQRSINGTWSPQWESSHIYKYNINITGSSAGIEPIVFAASQELGSNQWDSSTEVSMVFGVDYGTNE